MPIMDSITVQMVRSRLSQSQSPVLPYEGRKVVLTKADAVALKQGCQLNVCGMGIVRTHNIPSPRIHIRDDFCRLFICRFQSRGIGMIIENSRSVVMFNDTLT